LIILDLMMDGMDGFEVALRLRSQAKTANIPIVVLTAADLTEEEHRRLHGKITAYVRKGEEEHRSLVTVIRGLLARHRSAVAASARREEE
jgi:CheY-like chemotaxis protein